VHKRITSAIKKVLFVSDVTLGGCWCLNETYSKVRIGTFSSYVSHPKYPKTRRFLLPLLSNFALKYTIRKLQENQVGLKVNGTHQFLAYADDVNLLGDNIDTIKKKNFNRS
jgi:hypothetical protein